MMRSAQASDATPPVSTELRKSAQQRERPLYRWLRVAVTTAALSLGAYLWTIYQPPLYRAECVLQYERESLVASGAGTSELSAQEWYRTQDFLLASNSVAERVVEALDLHRDPGFFGLPASERFAKSKQDAATLLLERLEVDRVEGTRLVRLAIEDTSGKRAARIANTLAEKYLEKVLEDRVASTSRAMGWLSEKMTQTTQQLAQTEGEMHRFLDVETAPAVPLAERQAMLTAEIQHLTSSLTEARLRRIELAAQLAKLKAAQRDDPFEVHTAEIDQNEQVKQLRAAHTSLIVGHREAQAAQGAESSLVKSGEARLAALREQLNAVIDGVVESALAELRAAQSVESQLQALLKRTNETGRELQRQQLEFGRLERDRAQAEHLLKSLRERSAETGLSSAVGAANAKVVEAATVPKAPMERQPLRNAALGALTGLVVAALLKRLFGRQVRA